MASNTPDKGVSSRLLTMPFMQRAIAARTTSSPTTPKQSAPDPSSKKRKTGRENRGRTANEPPTLDQAALDAAIADEDMKRQAALEERAKELGDSRWVLHNPGDVTGKEAQKPLNVVQVGFTQIDDQLETSQQRQALRFNIMEKKSPTSKHKQPEDNEASDSESSSDGDNDQNSKSQDDNPAQQSPHGGKRTSERPKRSAIPSKRRGDVSSQLAALAVKRRKKDMNVNRPGSSSAIANMTCFGCGQKGHTLRLCPQA